MGKEGPVVHISLAIIIFIPVYIHSLCSFNTHGLSETSESDNIRMHVILTIAFLWLYYGDISHEMIFLLLVFIYSSIWTFMNDYNHHCCLPYNVITIWQNNYYTIIHNVFLVGILSCTYLYCIVVVMNHESLQR